MANRPRCVLILPLMPSPSGSGLQQRAFQVLSLLAQQFETAVLVACEATEMASCPIPLTLAVSVSLLPVTTKMTLGKRLAQWLPPLVQLHPQWATDWPQVDAIPTLPFASASPIALCIVFRLRMHPVVELLRANQHPLKIALDLDDVESRTLASIGWFALRRGRVRMSLRSFSKAFQSWCLQRMLLKHYDRVYLANPDDVETLRSIAGGAELMYLPNRILLSTQTASPPSRGAIHTLLFIGTLGYFPNEDAALWIVESILPELRNRIRTPFCILIAGRNASPQLRAKMQGIPEVEFLGEVPDVESLYAEADLALVVVRCGGGTKIKALEAAAYQCPIVGTSHAMRGLGFEQGRDYLCGDTAEDVADCCALLLQQPARANAMAQDAYDRLTRLSSVESEEATSNNFPS